MCSITCIAYILLRIVLRIAYYCELRACVCVEWCSAALRVDACFEHNLVELFMFVQACVRVTHAYAQVLCVL